MPSELRVVLLGSKTSGKSLVGNLILGVDAFNATDATFDCETREGGACKRRVTVVRAPGWHDGYKLCDTPELMRMEVILSASQCPAGLHAFILVINAEKPFRTVHRRATQEHLCHFFGERVWDHTIVVFSPSGHLSPRNIGEYLRKEGAPLQSVLDACGGRHLVLCGDTGNAAAAKVKELFAKIDAMVAERGCYEMEGTLVQRVREIRADVDRHADKLRQRSVDQRETLRNLLTGQATGLRILMVGWVFSGKSATGNSILKVHCFQPGERTLRTFERGGVVAGRQVLVTDTPGWWKFFPAKYNSRTQKSEMLAGVSSCKPNVILLAVPLDASFTDEQQRVTEENMQLLGPGAWRHMIVLFTFGDTLGGKSIEQHIESEGPPLLWLLEKCGWRYHVQDNKSGGEGQVRELLEKMEEMVAGNSSFHLAGEAHPEDEGSDAQESKAQKIGRHLAVQWNCTNWTQSMDSPLKFNEASDSFEVNDDRDCSSVKVSLEQLEREWSRREASMEISSKRAAAKGAPSEPDSEELQESREKVSSWLKTSV